MNIRYFRKIISFFLIFSTLFTPYQTSAASKDSSVWPKGPSVYADAAIVMEANTGLVLYEKDIYDQHYPASITKIMTTLLALENCNLHETVTMSHEAEWDVDFDSSRIGLVEGESLSLEDALYGVMLESSNEVSYAVGEHVAKGPIKDFSAMMNARAKELGCKNTNFVNPHGLHDDNHYTCAYDMALISQAAIKLPEFRTITGSRTHTIPATNKNVARPLANHHRFIRKTMHYDGCIGGKTGGTDEAKTTLVTFAERDGLTLIAVVLHVDTGIHAYEDTAKILDFAFNNYSLYKIQDSALAKDSDFPPLFSKTPEFASGSINNLRINKNSSIVLPNQANFEDAKKTIEYLPVEEFQHGDNIVGKISYTYQDKFVGSADIIYYNEAYPLTDAQFKAQWPSYLISPEVIFSKTDKPNSETITVDDGIDSTKTSSNLSSKIRLPLFIIGGLLLIIAVLYLLFIELPHRRKRRAYRRNHLRRMNSFRDRSHDFYE